MPCPMTRSQRDVCSQGRIFRWAAVTCSARIVLVALCASTATFGAEPAVWSAKSLPASLRGQLRLFGHRNWIVVADSAYPWQSHPGIQTVSVARDQIEVVEEVLRAVDSAKHVRGVVHLDAELKSVPERDAPGVEVYRKKLAGLLKNRPLKTMPHEELIANLDQAAKTFRILIIKTDMAIPYTSVFVQLDCGYWSAEKEKRLREVIDAQGK